MNQEEKEPIEAEKETADTPEEEAPKEASEAEGKAEEKPIITLTPEQEELYEKKAKRSKIMYSVELLAFAAIFLVLGILLFCHVINLANNTFRIYFAYITCIAAWIAILDFLWTLLSQKRRAKSSLLDKALSLPALATIIALDILYWVKGAEASQSIHQYGVAAVFVYIALDYLFQGIYHYKHPVPDMRKSLDDLKEEIAEGDEDEALYEEDDGEKKGEAEEDKPEAKAEEAEIEEAKPAEKASEGEEKKAE